MNAARNLIVGVGCRRGTSADSIIAAIIEGLEMAGLRIEDLGLLASAEPKADEPGLLEAALRLGLPLRIISSEEIRSTTRQFGRSDFVQTKVGLPAVAEPAALLAGRRTELILPKTIIQGITIAVVREDCL